MYRIARNLLIDYYRRAEHRAHAPLHEADGQAAPEPDPIILVDQQLSVQRLHQALAMLDETQREIVTLRFISGLSLEETANALGKTEAAVKAHQHRGLLALRRALAEEQVPL